MVKFLLKIIPYFVVARVYYFIFRNKKNKFSASLQNKGYKFLKDLDIFKNKTSSKLFIIGSGYSLNNISESEWKQIEENDSFGFGFSFLTDHIPTFYSIESTVNTESNEFGRSKIGELVYQLFMSRKETYKDVIKIVSDLDENNITHFENFGRDFFDENLYVVNTVNGIGNTEEQLEKLIKYYIQTGVFERENQIDKLFKFRATLSMAISFGIKMGYEEIILCGIDLSDPRYFFEDKIKYPNLPDFYFVQKNRKHVTMLRYPLFVPINIVVKTIYERVCKEKGIKLYVQNPESALAEFLPIYKF